MGINIRSATISFGRQSQRGSRVIVLDRTGRRAKGYYAGDCWSWPKTWTEEARADKRLRGCMSNIDRSLSPMERLNLLTKSESINAQDFAKGLKNRLPDIIERQYKVTDKSCKEYAEHRDRIISQILIAIPS